MSIRRGSRGGAGAPPAPATAAVAPGPVGPAPRKLFSFKVVLVLVVIAILLALGMVGIDGFSWGLSVSIGIPLLALGLYFGWPYLKKLAAASSGILWWALAAALLFGGYHFWWKPDPGTPEAIYDPEPRFLGLLWKSGEAPPYTKDGLPNYWAVFAGAEWNNSMWAFNRGPQAPDTLVHKLDPDMQACLEPSNVATLTAGGFTFTVCQSGPSGLPYFEATPEVRTVAKAMEDCGGTCDWVPGRLSAAGMSPDPGTVLINQNSPRWIWFDTGLGGDPRASCFVYEPKPAGLNLVTMSYLDMNGNWHAYDPSMQLSPGGYIEAQAFKMENNGPFPVPVSIGSQALPRNMHGNLRGRPYVCLRAS